MEKLTKRVGEGLETLKVGVLGSDLFVWDRELKGFGVQVSPQGLKSFIVQFRRDDNPGGGPGERKAAAL